MTSCEGIELKEKCSNCTMICYPMVITEDSKCEDFCPPNCEKICEKSSCMLIPIPKCQQITEYVGHILILPLLTFQEIKIIFTEKIRCVTIF